MRTVSESKRFTVRFQIACNNHKFYLYVQIVFKISWKINLNEGGSRIATFIFKLKTGIIIYILWII